jgi:hypothetical protein
MTIAVDIKTGAVVGQVCDVPALAGPPNAPVPGLMLLTKSGTVIVPADSVRLETLR